MEKIRGVNLGNWLVLEKWMLPEIFEGTGAEDEVTLNRKMDPGKLKAVMKNHRDTYITEEDFAYITKQGIRLVRIPVPYFIFGDRPPFNGCAEYLDRAMDWAEKYGLEVLIDLHTVPGSQNGYDNGGLTGVCKWCKNPEEVEFALGVLERLAKRYGKREGLYGIEVLNEPISWSVYVTAPSTGKAADPEEAKGSGHVPMSFLKKFYLDAYARLRRILPDEKVIVFHDGFRLKKWGSFFKDANMKNVILDTHIYVYAMEFFVPIHLPWVYRLYIKSQERLIRRASREIPVVVGEWCICNRYAEKKDSGMNPKDAADRRRSRYLDVAAMQMKAWESSAGWIYWSYQFRRDRQEKMDEDWKESWDFSRCIQNGWLEIKEA